MSEHILVIKLGALGDFVQASGPFAAIRAHHAGSRIVLLTSQPFADFAQDSPWFDEVWTDSKPRLVQIYECLKLRAKLRAANFSRIYDLQTSDRSNFYFRLFWPGPYPEWSGIARGCSHPHANPQRDFMHTVERQEEQLAMAGIAAVPAFDYAWVKTDISRFGLADQFALLAPGAAAHRPAKRWPRDNYRELSAHLAGQSIQPVLIGGRNEKAFLAAISDTIPAAINLAGETSMDDLFILAKWAQLAIGNDTGPMHAFAAGGSPTIILYSHESDPALCAQRGDTVSIIQRKNLASLSVSGVIDEIGNVTSF